MKLFFDLNFRELNNLLEPISDVSLGLLRAGKRLLPDPPRPFRYSTICI